MYVERRSNVVKMSSVTGFPGVRYGVGGVLTSPEAEKVYRRCTRGDVKLVLTIVGIVPPVLK